MATEQYVTTNSSDYVSLDVTLSDRTWLSFQVRASSSATVGLTEDYMNYTANHIYELVLGVFGMAVYYTQLKYTRASRLKLHRLDLLRICCTTSSTTTPQQVRSKSNRWSPSLGILDLGGLHCTPWLASSITKDARPCENQGFFNRYH